MKGKEENSKTAVMGTQPVGRLLLSMSLPAILGMMAQASYNVADALFIGWTVGPVGLAGVAVVFPLSMLVIACILLVGFGGASLVSRSLGAGDRHTAEHAVNAVLTMSLVLGVLTSALNWVFMDEILRLLGASGESFEAARTYQRIILIGQPVAMVAFSVNHCIRALGYPQTAMMSLFISAFINIILDPICIIALDMGIAGAAWATVIAQVMVMVWEIYFFARRKDGAHPRFCVPRVNIACRILSIGSSDFARMGSTTIVAGLLMNVLANYGGPYAIAAYGIFARVSSFAFLPLVGICQGMQPIVGYNYGAGNFGRTRRIIILAIAVATAVSCAGWFVFHFFSYEVVSLFTPNEELRSVGSVAMRTMCLGFMLVGAQAVGTTVYQAMGLAGTALFLSLTRQVIFVIPMLMILPPMMGLEGVWFTMPAADTMSVLITTLFLIPRMRELKRMSGPAGGLKDD